MKNYFILTALLCCFFSARAQSPIKSINYQALIVDPAAIELPGSAVQAQLYLNKDIWVKFGIYAGTTLQFEELHKTKTDAYGLINLEIGAGENTSSAGTFASINWGGEVKRLETQVSFDLGFKYTDVSNRGLNYLPYAHFAGEAGKLSGTLALTSGGTGAITAHAARANLGLDKVDNTADASKPISMATQAALDLKANAVDINAALALKATVAALEAHMAVTADTIMLATKAALTDLNDYAPIASPTFTGTVSGITKSMVGLGSADNTTDAAKPISTATKAALDLKLNSNGNAAIATKLATARNINGVAFDGSADITITSTADAGTLTGTTLKFTVTGSSLTSVGTLTNLTVTNPIAGSITGNAATATTAGTATTTTGNAATATKLATARNINGVAFDGSADITIAVDANTLTGTALASSVVTSGLTSVGTLTNLTVTNPIAGSITGNAASATKLATARNINGVAFDGSVDITIAADANTLTGTALASNVVTSGLTSVGTLTNLTVTNPIAGSITGNAATATTAGTATTTTGNAGTATKLATARNINGVAFDGSTDITITSTADAGTLTGTTLKSTVIGSSLTSVGTLTNLTVTNPIAGSVTGNAGTATNLTGLTTSVATLNNLSGVNSGDQTTITGNAATATKLAASKTINGVAFDGTADITAPAAAETLTGTTLKSTVTGSSLTSVGTITSGVWSGTAVAIQKGGTGLTTVGTNGQVLTSNGTSITWATASGGSGVPYTGATGAVDLGAYDLKVYGLTIGRGGGNVDGNTANGNMSLYSNSSGYSNTAYGSASLYSNTSGSLNTANGFRSLYSNIASYNTAYGSGSLYSNTTGVYNTANGVNSLYLNTTGSNNTANGLTALYSNTTGSQNTAVGYDAGRFITNGSTNNTKSDYSVYLGSKTKASADNAQNEVVIGYYAIGAGSNTVQLGNTGVTNVKTSGTLTAGDVTYPKTHGTANQVLSTTGSGTLTWTTPSAGGSGGGTYTIGLNSDLGGYVFFLSTDFKHGLVAETIDQSTSSTWYDAEDKISNQANHSTNGKKFTDWRLPTKHELNLMYAASNSIFSFTSAFYWSSTENDSTNAWYQFPSGSPFSTSKNNPNYVRAVRAF